MKIKIELSYYQVRMLSYFLLINIRDGLPYTKHEVIDVCKIIDDAIDENAQNNKNTHG